jgi:hypothetical protein
MMRKLLLATLISIFSAQVSAQTETNSGDFILKLPGKGSMFVQGFRTYFAGEYVAPEKNLAVLRELKKQMPKIRIADFSADDPEMTTLVCRMSWPLYAPAKLPYTVFLAGAMRDELTREGLYSSNDGIEVTGRLDSINFESFGSAKWKIAATFSVEGKTPVTVKHETAFPVGFGASSACTSVRDNLVPAMQEFLFAVYSDPQFQALMH